MKKHILLIIFALGTAALQAQNYQPMLTNSSNWYVQGYEGGIYGTTKIAYIQKDSTINGTDYKCLMDTLADNKVQLLREDTATKQIWEYNPLGAERLRYDFSLDANDTVELVRLFGQLSSNPWVCVVDSVFNISTLTGTHKAWKLSIISPKPDHVTEPVTGQLGILWIEGIGSSMGPAYYNYPVKVLHSSTQEYTLLCKYEASSHVYSFYGNDSCEINYGNPGVQIEKNTSDNFQAYAYSSKGKSYLNLSSAEGGRLGIDVFDLQGRRVHTIPTGNVMPGRQTISLPDMKNGVYILKLQLSGNDKVWQKNVKVMVE